MKIVTKYHYMEFENKSLDYQERPLHVIVKYIKISVGPNHFKF